MYLLILDMQFQRIFTDDYIQRLVYLTLSIVCHTILVFLYQMTYNPFHIISLVYKMTVACPL